MNQRAKNMSEYVEIIIPFYKRWTYRHEFLTRGQREGETIREYFRAKQELLLEGDPYGNLRAAYPAFWSGLRDQGLGDLLDILVWGHPWPRQIVGKSPQIEEWAATVAPDLEALQDLLSRMERQQALGKQIRALRRDKGPGQPGEPGAGTPTPTPAPAAPEGRESAGGPTAEGTVTGMAAASWGPEGEGCSTPMLGGNERDPRGEGRSRAWAGGYTAAAEPSLLGAAEAGYLTVMVFLLIFYI